MTRLLLPERYQRESLKAKWVAARAEQRAAIRALMDFDDPVCVEWRPDLQKLDPHLDMGRAKPGADSPEHAVRGGYYYIVVWAETAPVSLIEITGPDNESFAVPDSRMLDDLRSNDLQNPEVWAGMIKARARREKALAHKEALQREQRVFEGVDRVKSYEDTRVSLDRDNRWSASNRGRRGRRS